MSELLDRIFGLHGLGFGDPQAAFTFARPMPAWAWMLIIAGLAALAWGSYWRLESGRRARLALAILRTLLLAMLVVLASGPQLRKDNERTEEDWVIVMADRSRSMEIPDAGEPGSRATRDAELKSALQTAAETFAQLAQEKRVLWLGFDSGVFEVKEGQLSEATGRSTAIGASLSEALARVAGRPVSGVVILSDGRSVDKPERSVMRAVESQRIPIFTVPLGSERPIGDIAVQRVVAPDVVFADDVLTAQVELAHCGGGPSGEVELVDLDTGRVLDRAEASVDASGKGSVTLSGKLGDAGKRRLAVRAVPAGEDLIAENNQIELAVESVDRPLRVLYLDGYPRWEERYLKNLLMRERSVKSSSLLLSSTRRYQQEGDVEIASLPQSVEEWAEYDVVIIGDLRPELLGDEALSQLREHVATRGAGLIWIAGPGAMPSAWRGTPLADLLPMTLDSEGAVTAYSEPVTMTRTPEAASLGLLGLQQVGEGGAEESQWPLMLSDPGTGWSRLRWAQRIDADAIKPGAVELATLTPQSAWQPGVVDGPDSTAGVLLMRFGAGSSAYVATDETWRWRYGRGEDLSERFWVPLIRQLGRASLERGGRSALLTATPEDAAVAQPVRIKLELLDQSLIDARPSAVGVRIIAPDATAEALTLSPSADGGGRFFTGTWIPQKPGRFDVKVDDPLLSQVSSERAVRVTWPDDESRRPETDHDLLRQLSADTGGQVLSPGELDQLQALLPNREVTVAGRRDIQTLWDRPIVLIVLMVLLGLEWLGRRLIRLA